MAFSSNQRNTTVFLAAAGLVGVVAALYLQAVGGSDESLGLLIRSSGKLALVVLLVVFVARPLRQMLATPTTTTLLQNRRLLGIAFAGIHTGHLGLLIVKANLTPEFGLGIAANVLGVLTYVVILTMLITSYDGPARALGAKRWKILHKVGLYWVFAAFAQTQLPESLDDLAGTNWWLIVLIGIAVTIRLTAYLAKRK